MEQQSQSKVKAPAFSPVFLPSWIIGKAEPKELALIFVLQAYGASTEWVELEIKQLSEATLILKGALPILLKKLETKGWIARKKDYREGTKGPIYCFKLFIWNFDERD